MEFANYSFQQNLDVGCRMLFKNSKAGNSERLSCERRSRTRRLQLDLLEDRRLLAGIELFVFDDANQSRTSHSESGVAGQVAFIDLNRDSRHGFGEPLAVTNSEGIASFSGIDPGVYSIRLLGSNKSIEQTTPVRPALTASQLDVPVSQFVGWSNNGELLWGVDGNRIVGVDPIYGWSAESISFDGFVREIATVETTDGRLQGFALVDGEEGTNVAPFETGLGAGFATSNPVNGAELSSLTNVGSRFIAWNDANKEIVLLENDGAEVALKPLDIPSYGSFIGLRSVTQSRIAVLELVGNTQRLSLYDLNESVAVPIAHRFLTNTVLDWAASADGDLIFVDQGTGIGVYDTGFGIQNVVDLPGTRWPLLEDSERKILYTGSRENSSSLDAWNVQDWKKSSSTSIGFNTPSANLFLSRDSSELLALHGNQLHSRELLSADAVEAEIGTAQRVVSIGIRKIGQNSVPQIDFGTDLTLDEDTIATLGANLLQSMARDSDGDAIYWVVVSQPLKGTLDWSTDEGGIYVPNTNENGADSLWIAAFDGAGWSASVPISVLIAPINDVPTDMRLSLSHIDENIGPNHFVTMVSVVDPDIQDQYEITVSDSRFRVIDKNLFLVDGAIDFEIEPYIPILVTAVNRNSSAERMSKMVTLNVVDRNDPPRGLLLGDMSITEMLPGNVLGDLRVDDQDSTQDYDWSVDDPRFEVRDGKLILKDGYQIDYENESLVSLSLRATDRSSGWTVEQTVSVSVIDQNDPPVGMLAAAGYDVPEDAPGAIAGFVYVDDPDYGEEYLISVSDSRFEVVDNTLKLIEGESLTWVEPGFVDVTLTAVSLRNGAVLSKQTRIHIVKDATPYHNDQDPADVDGNGVISPIDALIIVNYINNFGPGVINPEGEGPVPNLDVDGDGMVSPIDLLIIVNIINGSSNTQDYISADPESTTDQESVTDDDVHSIPETEGESSSPATPLPVIDVESEISRRRRR